MDIGIWEGNAFIAFCVVVWWIFVER